jgi:hypothetical protein
LTRTIKRIEDVLGVSLFGANGIDAFQANNN